MKDIPSDKNFKSRKDWEEYIWLRLVTEFSAANSVEVTGKSLDILLTAREKRQMIYRASAISLLKKGISYREIGKILWLSPTTISAIRKSMREKDGYVSRKVRNKKLAQLRKASTEKESARFQFSSRIESFFTLPAPPLRHPRLMRSFDFKGSSVFKSKHK